MMPNMIRWIGFPIRIVLATMCLAIVTTAMVLGGIVLLVVDPETAGYWLGEYHEALNGGWNWVLKP